MNPYICRSGIPTWPMTEFIRHPGIVESTDEGKLRIRITQTSGCAACRAKGYCSSVDAREMRMEVPASDATSYRPGEAVWVVGHRSIGRRAVCWAFVFPLLLVLVSLLLLVRSGINEALAACVSLALLIPYYILLRLCRKQLAERFVFTVTR